MGERQISCDDGKADKKPRKRMKAVLTKIKEQMEFYFSDSNLLKDRFLKKKMDETQDKYVNLEMFLSFNKILALTSDIEILRKALSKSSMLQLNEQKTEVRRTTPLKDPKDVDDKTVYVECLPFGVDHDWVRRVFSSCGHVLYVSLPKYRTSGDPKGFAFVEFDSIEGAQKACEMLNNPPADANELPGHFPKTSKTLTQLEKQLPHLGVDGNYGNTNIQALGSDVCKDGDGIPTDQPVVKTGSKKDKKRQRQVSECSVESNGESATKKKQKVGDISSPDTAQNKELKSEDKLPDTTKELIQEGTQNLGIENRTAKAEKRKADAVQDSPPKKQLKSNSQEDSTKKKANKRKARARKRKNKEREVPEIRVIPKHDWLMLRNEYIALQKSNMSKLKLNLLSLKEGMKKKEKEGRVPKTMIDFVPGVIIQVTSENPLKRTILKEELSKYGGIAYFDVKDGLTTGHIRCENSDCAEKLKNGTLKGCSFVLLEGKEETQYWDKLKLDRANKFNSTTRPKKRGTQKVEQGLISTGKLMQNLIERGEKAHASALQGKHVVFGDD